MPDYQYFSEQQVRHLEMIQGVIHRLGNATVLTKRWAISLNAVLLSFALYQTMCVFAVVSALAMLTFWILDYYFLRSERLFRSFYEYVRTTDEPEPFLMEAPGEAFMSGLGSTDRGPGIGLWQVFLSRTLLVVYGLQILVAAIVFLALTTGLMG